ncbi:patatin-like phospholipase family protein [Caulobacter mirabilis]|uniref:Patatin n=1 Tax=Caulobacter mirabilis TaxID=69666 RepID=A0A2D2AZ92_9CAUL|nr:patatin-like phospholipase family protein [Caulobacter mirabilis]ATQ43305.1 patatin [Caulobacter mirabilis]
MSDWPGRRRGGSARLPPPPGAGVPGFDGLRLTVDEAEESLAEAADRLALPKSLWTREDFNLLAISGGAAGGAFGAGALVGLTRAGARPHFAIVTGVSTGALLAPFAFLGSDWDDELADAYIGGHANRLLGGPLGPALGSLLRAEGLERLISPFVGERMIDAVAREHAAGRRLLVATTDLDRQKTVIWDMGAIASRGGEAAVALFRDVLIASSSLPGLFPPRRFRIEIDGEAFEELHVDGGVSTPLFLMPEAMLRWKKLGRRLHRGRVYVIVNTVLEQAPRTTQPNLPSVLMRSFDTMLRFSYRQALGLAATFCAGHNLPLSVTSILDDPNNGSMLNFDTASMKRVFDAAAARAEAGTLWTTPVAEQRAGLLDGFRPW